jgi:hypothetical protein
MILDGEPVVEIDIRASYLAHAIAGEPYDPGADACGSTFGPGS